MSAQDRREASVADACVENEGVGVEEKGLRDVELHAGAAGFVDVHPVLMDFVCFVLSFFEIACQFTLDPRDRNTILLLSAAEQKDHRDDNYNGNE